MRRLAWLLPVFLLAACARPEPQPAQPALWRVDGPRGQVGFVFGTIHALDRPAQWRNANVDAALNEADRIVVEGREPGGRGGTAKDFRRDVGLGGIAVAVGAGGAGAASAPRRAAAQGRCNREPFRRGSRTWAAALALARAETDAQAAANGIDRAVLAVSGGRPVVELEGASEQFGIFDALPEQEQRDLLAEVLRDEGAIDSEDEDVAAAWRKGDMTAIEAETRSGLLADPELREALFTARNRAWSDKIAAMLARGERPFVAVGAAHMAGPDGLASMLAARGYSVTRVQ